ncbi:MAG: choice-of-anchor D domain-containing protein, partial [Planctomycetaceae bacterium]|nr:choice-of-anchor D domain-containing protein [Planctomycetaceae bacterium]
MKRSSWLNSLRAGLLPVRPPRVRRRRHAGRRDHWVAEVRELERRILLTADLTHYAFSGIPNGGADSWDDSIVISTVTGTHKSATSFSTAQNIFVDIGWLNAGDTSSGSSYLTELRLDGVQVSGANYNSGPHNSGSGSLVTDINLGTLSAGMHTLTLNVDHTNVVAENNSANNSRTRTFLVEAGGATHDYGDAPTAAQSGLSASYPTLLADGGARHGVRAGFQLGVLKDLDANGRPTATAVGDDALGATDDEDGVSFDGPFTFGQSGSFNVSLTNTAGASNPHLDVWIDFNRDGDWNDVEEQIYSQNIAGATAVNFTTPGSAAPGYTYARFRLYDGTAALTPGGTAADGEVEDYRIQIVEPGQWIEQGPNATQNAQIRNVAPDNRVTGAIQAVLAHPTNPNVLYVGSVNGGIWKTTNATAANPTWTPQTDFLGSLSIGAMAFDPTDAARDTLVAGTGLFSSFGSIGGTNGAVYLTTNGGATWTNPGSSGLANQNVSGIAVRGNTIVVSSSHYGTSGPLSFGGLFRSTNGGASFTGITSSDLVVGDDVHDLIVDPSDPTGQRLYAAARAKGVYRSDDFGQTWTKITGSGINAAMNTLLTNSTNDNIEMAVHPTTGRLYVVISLRSQPRGIFYTNSGASGSPTWTEMDVPVLPLAPAVALTNASNATPIVITATNHGLVTDNYVVISGVTGNTAANGSFQITRIDANSFSLNGSAGNGAYAGGGTWTKVASPNPRAKDPSEHETGGQGYLHFSVAVSPANEDLVYIGGDRQEFGGGIGDTDFNGAIFRGNAAIARNPSLAPSPQWDHLTHDMISSDPAGGTASGSAPHADSRDMTFDASGNLLEVDDGGIFKRTSPHSNAGDWFSLAGNLGVTEFHDIAYDGVSNVLFGGTQDNGVHLQSVEGNSVWDHFSKGDGGDVEVDDASLAGSNQSIRYSSNQNLGSFLRSTWDAAGRLLSAVTPARTVTSGPTFSAAFRTPLELNAIDPTRLIIQGSNAVYESLNQANSMASVGTGFGTTSITQNAIAYGGRKNSVNNADVLWVAGGSTVYNRTSGTGSVAATAAMSGASTIRDLTIDPDDWAAAYAVDNDQVFSTTNTGASWANVTGNLLSLVSDIRSVVYVATAAVDALLVGTNLGVFAANAATLGVSTTWARLGENLPNALVYDMDYDATDNVLVAGTLGRGAWTIDNISQLVQDAFIPPTVRTSDDGQTAFTTTGAWNSHSLAGRGSDLRYLNPTAPAGTATWAFNGLQAGQYRVSATWPTGLGAAAATNAPFTVKETLAGPVLRAKAINENVPPNDLTDAGSLWEDLGVVTIHGNSLFVQLTNVGAETWVVADAIRIERIMAVPSAPEIAVMQGTAAISDGGLFDFGTTTAGTPLLRTFTIHNVGNTNLILQPATPPSGFSITTNFTVNQSVTPGASALLTVQLDAVAAGSFTGMLSFGTNDNDSDNIGEDESPFDVFLTGTVAAAGGLPLIVDDGDGGFSTTGSWATSTTSGGRGNDLRYLNPSSPAGTATWSFSGLTAGRYRVSATWPTGLGAAAATNAPFTIRATAGGPALHTIAINENAAPSDFPDAGSQWEDLASMVSVSGTTLVVELTNVGAETWVVADAIRIERVGALPAVPEIVVQDGATALADGVSSVSFGNATVGTPVSKTFTIYNTGATTLTLQPATAPPGFTVTTNFTANQAVAPGASALLTVRLDATSAGSFTGQLSFATDDGDENPFNFTISGEVFAPGAAPVIVDDGDSAFTLVSGNWETWTASGRGGDLRYIHSVGQPNWPSNASATTGVVRWSFTGLTAGQYRVSATWPDPDGTSGRATNAPYRILDAVGGAQLASAPRDQNLAPDDRTDQGSKWEDLATVNITVAGILIVELGNGNHYVLADAIRIERLGPPADTSADSASGDSGVSLASGDTALTAGTITTTA